MYTLSFAILSFLSLAIFFGGVANAACTYKSVRLFNGITTSSRGTVQVCNSSRLWSDVCDYQWSYTTHSKVVCKQLGYTHSKPITTYNAGPARTGKFSFMSSSSSGYCSSTKIGSCLTPSHYYLYNSYRCSLKRDTVYLDCNPQTKCAISGKGRLYNTTSYKASTGGMLQICASKLEWTAVCGFNWQCSHAVTACKQLGYTDPTPTYRNNAGGWTEFGYGPYSYCSSSAARLSSCSVYSSSFKTNPNYCNPTTNTVYLNCNNNIVKPTCSPNYSVRLVNDTSNSSSEGRLEVCLSGYWRVLCGSNLNAQFASTVCNQLGYTLNNFATIITDGRYGVDNLKQTFSYARCYGSGVYNHISNCGISYSTSKCIYECSSYAAGIKCFTESDNCNEDDLRLVNGTEEGEGRLEVCVDGVWGAVCSGNFKRSSAYVACKQAGYTDSDDAIIDRYGKYGLGDRPIVYTNVDCFGSESKLAECSKTVSPSFTCYYPNIIGLKCLDTCEEGEVKLVGGVNELEGTVEVCIEKRWELVSDSKWDEKDASVVCRQMKHGGGEAILKSQYGKPKRSIVYSNVNCRGTEAELRDCTHHRLASGDMDGTVAGVRCSPGAGSKVPDFIVSKIACNNTQFALKGCSGICASRTTNCIGSKLTKFGNCVCASCTESRNQPSQDLTVTLDDAKNYRCNEYCTKVKKCFDGICDRSQNACVCHYCQADEMIKYLKELD